MRGRWAATMLLMLAVAGCGGSGSSDAVDGPIDPPGSSLSSPGETPSETSDPPQPDEEERCPYLTAGQVSTALGTPTRVTAGSVHACFFDPEGGRGPSVMLSKINVQIEPAEYAAQTRALCQGEVTDVELGDEAFACVMSLGPQGQLYAGQVLVTVNLNGAADDATGLTMAVALLREVTIPPES